MATFPLHVTIVTILSGYNDTSASLISYQFDSTLDQVSGIRTSNLFQPEQCACPDVPVTRVR